MYKFIFVLAAAVLYMSCSDSMPVEVTVEERVADIEKTVARIGVDGMMCEIACGGKIRKELSELGGVALATIDYDDDAEVNYALVEYNPALVSERELVQTINRIGDGKLYEVTDVLVTRYAPSGEQTRVSGTDGVNMRTPKFVIPSITDVIWNLIGGFKN